MTYSARLNCLFKKLGKKVDAVLVFGDGNLLRFLTGHGEGNAIAKSQGVEFVVPKMLAEAASKTRMKVHSYSKRDEYLSIVEKLLGKSKNVGIRFDVLSHSYFLDIQKTFKKYKLVNISPDINEAFVEKDKEEIDSLRKACELTALAAKTIPSMLRSGITEIELMREINHTMKMIGGGFVSFGENCAHPHHQCSERRLRKGDFVMADFGCTVGGVGSDITRTFCYGRASNKQKQVYAEVWNAQKLAFDMVKDGKELADINKAVNEMFEKDGYGAFIHSIGHSLGFFGTGFKNVKNQVVTVEPGIYISGFGGVRIEDDILITKDKQGFVNLTKASPTKELIEV
jgi:Xaa-Pro aminopeptidase